MSPISRLNSFAIAIDRLKHEGPRVSTGVSDVLAAGGPRPYGLMTTFTQPSDFSWNIL